MNREIKFRGISNRTGDWIYGDLVRLPTDGGNWNEPPSSELTWHITNSYVLTHEFVEVKPETVGQCTGLTDKSGKGIYEGDILIYIGTNMSEMTVEFKDGCFVGVGPFNTRPMIDYISALDFDSIEIIGDIHQTPELL
jgi:uncharacterized phage protein (TIGR01671 family)